jgi:hypothetical protein
MDIKYASMLFPFYQNMVSLIAGFPIWRCSGIFMNVAVGEHIAFDSEISKCGNINYSISINVTNFV